jgi:hypothetical protein
MTSPLEYKLQESDLEIVVDPGNVVSRKYLSIQERIFDFGWKKVLGW